MRGLRILVPLLLALVLSFGVSTPVLAHGDGDGFGESAAEAKERAHDLVDNYKKMAQQETNKAEQKTLEKSAELRQ